MTRIDTVWSDYFWHLKNPETKEFDDKLLNLLAFVALNETVREDLSKFDNSIKALDNKADLTYYKFNNLALLGESTIISYIDILDLLVSSNSDIQAYLNDETYFKKQAIIKNAFDDSFNIRYADRIFHYGIFRFLNANKNSLNSQELSRWDRLIRNLVTHTIYDSSKDYQESIVSIDNMLKAYSGDIYSDFLHLTIRGFDGQQIAEEKLKIELMTRSTDWVDLITTAEAHQYLDGQIIFLLAYSGIFKSYQAKEINWITISLNGYLESAKLYFEKFQCLFTDFGLRTFENEIFRRALLAKGDYLLYSNNYSLVIDNGRDISWKRLLRESGNTTNKASNERAMYLKHLLDDIQINDIEGSLQRIILDHTCTDWRKDLVDHPVLMNTSQNKFIKFFNEDYIYILNKTKYNKYSDPEVKSLLLKELLLGKGIQEQEIKMAYIETLKQYGITQLKNQQLDIVYNHDGNKKYFIRMQDMEGTAFDTPEEVLTHVQDLIRN